MTTPTPKPGTYGAGPYGIGAYGQGKSGNISKKKKRKISLLAVIAATS
jgi:hypothetical protein